MLICRYYVINLIFLLNFSFQCTYVEVKQVDKTYAVILSKPAWMWGCEMGANDQGVAIGNGLTLSKLTDTQSKTLLGTDLVRYLNKFYYLL